MNKKIMEACGFSKEVKLVENLKCPICQASIHMEDFKDPLSIREYQISGMCQKCQDKIFG